MNSGTSRYRAKTWRRSNRRRGTQQVVFCTGLRHSACMAPRRRLRTADYPQAARDRLGEAVTRAREAAGHRSRPSFAKTAAVSLRSLAAVEQGEPGVGQSVLYAIGRALPNWTEDTPRIVLDGGPIPPTAAEIEDMSPRDEFEQKVVKSRLPREEQLEWIRAHRAALAEERRTLHPKEEDHPNVRISSNNSKTR